MQRRQTAAAGRPMRGTLPVPLHQRFGAIADRSVCTPSQIR